jgi:hypothetical protein
MDNKYKGMTVNERLFESGLIHEFDKAIENKDADKVIFILKEVELTDDNIYPILKQFKLAE